MKKIFGALCAAAFLAAVPAKAAQPHWHLVKSVPLGSPEQWDFVHLAADGERVYVAHGDIVSIVDTQTDKLIGTVGPIAGAHGVADLPALGRFYADNGKTGMVSVFDSKTLKRLGEIPVKTDADAMEFDAQSGLLIVADGDSGYTSLIDPKTEKNLADIQVGPGEEGIVTDGHGHAFINVSGTGQMARLDLNTRKVDARWPLDGCESPHGLAMDRASGRLFVSCRNATLYVVDARDGKVVARLPIGRDTDTAVFDPVRKLVFSSNKDGTVSVIAEQGGDRFLVLPSVKTAPGAATMAEDPKTGRFYVVAADIDTTLPSRRKGDLPKFTYKSGTAKLLIFEPAM